MYFWILFPKYKLRFRRSGCFLFSHLNKENYCYRLQPFLNRLLSQARNPPRIILQTPLDGNHLTCKLLSQQLRIFCYSFSLRKVQEYVFSLSVTSLEQLILLCRMKFLDAHWMRSARQDPPQNPRFVQLICTDLLQIIAFINQPFLKSLGRYPIKSERSC